MPNDRLSANDIEREIERDRSDLANTIEELRSRFTPEAVIAEVGRNIRAHGGDIGQAVNRSVKQNPIGLALTGVGLAWLMFGRSHDDSASTGGQPGARRLTSNVPDEYGDRPPRGPANPSLPADAGAAPSGYAPEWAVEDDDDLGCGYPLDNDAGDLDDLDASALDRATAVDDTLKAGAAGAAHSVASGAGSTRSVAGRVGSGVTSAAESVASGARSAGQGASEAARRAGGGISDAARTAAGRAACARARLAKGTEDLSEAARDRIVAARRRALEARRRAAATARDGWSSGRDTAAEMYGEYPLVAGALAVAVGAALAAALPRTRQEDDMVGDTSDRLFDEAERIYLEEREKAEKAAVAALDETRAVAGEKAGQADTAARSAISRIRDDMAEAGDRIASAAMNEADTKKLGKPGS